MSTSAIDLSRLPVPNIVEALDFETILAEQLIDLTARDPSMDGLLESDPAMKILQVTAYRELHIRQRVNEAARALMLAYAMDNDLDHLGALMDVPRLVVTPADPDKGTDAVMESNADLRKRIQLAPHGFSVAGPEGAYIFHALGADARVLDASATSPSPGVVMVTILSRDGDGTASQELIDIVAARLGADNVRPLTDHVLVESAQIIRYRVRAKLYTFPGPDAAVVVLEAQRRMQHYVTEAHRIGRGPTLSGIYAALHVDGVERVALTSPTKDLAISRRQAPFCDDIVVEYGGVYE
ncbi:baseplate J/gp47 family protein [Glaciimonas sp. PAMC28666]|uniref:baseplate assembly protein n=1 Tax=Glaciimonas sp. PAMC28666 TaxID=2807626 RepID=UPI0019641136|nr:baseplate J/gp47 family protein [Glaciimonas sp. PAMC28666]QRX80878.1 baseplate J/gp47 family protein [Glaciimonas sp. PAMC28666]QRX82304.1 baseplate J/gp47 family protein [Glaciimonas sp. PAMC28666]